MRVFDKAKTVRAYDPSSQKKSDDSWDFQSVADRDDNESGAEKNNNIMQVRYFGQFDAFSERMCYIVSIDLR